MHRWNVRYRGRVQGVGFRATVADVSSAFAVTGRVCNVRDGSVDLQAEGEEAELIRFRQAIGERLARYIVDANEHWAETEAAAWEDFGIGSDLDS